MQGLHVQNVIEQLHFLYLCSSLNSSRNQSDSNGCIRKLISSYQVDTQITFLPWHADQFVVSSLLNLSSNFPVFLENVLLDLSSRCDFQGPGKSLLVIYF